MFGQGRPHRRLGLNRLRWTSILLGGLVGPLALAFCLSARAADSLDVRLRIAWGGGEARSWQGTISISEGALSEATPLGLEPDEPGSMQLVDPSRIQINSRIPRTYDGCDVRVQAPADAKLLVQLTAPPFSARPPLELPLAKIIRDFTQFDLDDRKNRLLAQRSPGDSLRVIFSRSSLIFHPGEKFELEVQPQHLELVAGATYLLTAAIVPARADDAVWTNESEVRVEPSGSVPPVALAAPLPEQEGVYDLRLSLYPKRLINSNLVRGKAIASRSVQVVSVAPVKTFTGPPAAWQSVLAFDPANPKWWELMKSLPSWTRLPTLPRPIGSGNAVTASHHGRGWVQLAPRGWQAYPLSITTPGAPHILEVEYPSDLEQTLSISLIEPSAAGLVGPIGLDSGVEVSPPEAGHKAGVRRHRLPFWPQTKTPYVLLVNRRDELPASFGKIDVQAGPTSLPPLTVQPAALPTRTLAAYYDKPLFAENYSASEAVDPVSRRGLDDWVTFATGGQRLIESLQHGGYNAVVMTVACEGSAIYPSQLLEPTPKYDSGVFFDSGQDAIRKDVLELLFRLCDRSGMVLVPAVQFAGPLPQLEAIRHRGGAAAVGLEPLGPDGRTWLARTGNQGTGVYYNALDPRVQGAMIDVVAELAERYGQHASFGGVAVHLSGENYSLLPDETCSLDEVTFSRFLSETKADPPTSGEPAILSRWRLVREPAVQKVWLDWRSQQVARLYNHMRAEIVRQRPSAKLFLTTANLLTGRQLQTALRPELPPRNSAVEIMPLVGLDLTRFDSSIVVPRPQRVVSATAPPARDLEQHWNRHGPLDLIFLKQREASALQFLPPTPLRLPDFDAVSPFGADKTKTLLISQIAPADAAFRERFVNSIAKLDATLIMDGGWLLPLGQEAALAPLAKVYRRLPAESFEPAARGNQPQELVVRTLTKPDKTYFYAVNPTPWPLTAKIQFADKQPLRLTPYSDERLGAVETTAGGLTWTVELEPFDLVGGELASGSAQVVKASATPPPGAANALREQIGDVTKRVHYLYERDRTIPLVNAAFDQAAADGSVAGWIHAREAGMLAEVDRSAGSGGPGCLHLVNRGGAPLWVRSSPLPVPATGRLQMTAQIRLPDVKGQPQLRLAIEGRLDGQVYYRHVKCGMNERATDVAVQPISEQWSRFSIALTDLPMSGLTNLTVGFDLMGEGEVWIDDVQVTDLWLQDSEYKELIKSAPTAKYQADAGRLNESRLFVEGYWPSFLRRHVQPSDAAEPLPQSAAMVETHAAPPARPKPSILAPPITLPKTAPRSARTADRERNWWPSWMKWK
jgi:Glycosyl hydrolase-like 10